MDLKKFIKIFIVGIVCLMAFGENARAVSDSSASLTLNLGDRLENFDGVGTFYKEDLNSRDVIYCADSGMEVSSKCPNYVVVSDARNSKQLNYVFEYGYHLGYSKNDYLTGNSNEDYYITQFAVWNYTNNSADFLKKLNVGNETYNGETSELSQKISRLIKDANSKDKNPLLADKILTITASSQKLTKSGNYYVSGAINLKGIGLKSKIKLSVSGVNGAFVTTDLNATSGSSEFNNNSNVYVKVPASNMKASDSIILSASAKYSSGTVEIYKNSDSFCSGVQRLAKWLPSENDVSDKVSFGIDVIETTISKQSIVGGFELPGAHLVIKNIDGEVIEEWDSTTTPKRIYLVKGEYSLTETIAPKGYKLSSETIKFVIKNDNKIYINGKVVSEVVMKNEPIKVFISKRSISGKSELPGAKLAILDKDGNLVKDMNGKDLEWISTDTIKEFYIDAGEYILKEISAPAGFELSDKEIIFNIDKYGDVYIDGKKVKDNIIIFKNTPEPKQVPTGSAMFNIIIVIGILTIGVSSYIIVRLHKKNYI